MMTTLLGGLATFLRDSLSFWERMLYLPEGLLDPRTLLYATVLAYIFFWVWSRKMMNKLKNPPAKPPHIGNPIPCPEKPLPLLGHYNLLMETKDRVKFLQDMREKHGDIYGLLIGKQLVVFLNGYNVIERALMRHAAAFSDRPDSFYVQHVCKRKGLIGSSGRTWQRERAFCKAALRHLGVADDQSIEATRVETKEWDVRLIAPRIGTEGDVVSALMGRGLNIGNQSQKPTDVPKSRVTQRDIMADKIQQEVSRFIKHLQTHQGDPMEACHIVRNTAANVVCSVIIGKRFDLERGFFKRLMDTASGSLDRSDNLFGDLNYNMLKYLPGDNFGYKKEVENRRNLIKDLLEPVLDDLLNKDGDGRSKGGEEDFLCAYVREILNDDGKEQTSFDKLDKEVVLQTVADMVFSGTDTLTTALSLALTALVHYPEVQEKCYREVLRVVGKIRSPSMSDTPDLTYVETTIMEVLRRCVVINMTALHKTKFTIGVYGFGIPKDSVVVANLATALNDTNTWYQPLKFRPERFIGPDGKIDKPDEFIPFGIGRRACLAESVAWTGLFLYLTSLIQHFRFLPPVGQEAPSLDGKSFTAFHKPCKIRIVRRE